MSFADQLAWVLPCMIHATEIHVGYASLRSLLTGPNESDQ